MKKLVCCIFIVQLLLSVGCAPAGKQVLIPTDDLLSPAKLLTTTPSSRAPSATSTVTLTPFPTLTADETERKLLNLLHDNGGCTLPCLLGYSPGISTREEIQLFFNEFGVRDMPDLSVTRIVEPNEDIIRFFIDLDDNYLNMGISAFEDKEQVRILGIGSFSQPEWEPLYAEAMKYYMLPQILTNYGQPSQVLVLTFRDDRQRPDITTNEFLLDLLYPEQGFYLQYEMVRQTESGYFLGCPSESFVGIAVWNPEDKDAFTQVIQIMHNGGDLTSYRAIQDVTVMTASEFYQVFSNTDNEECIQTPIEKWPNP